MGNNGLVNLSPIQLEGRFVRLRPMCLDDLSALFEASDPSRWEWNPSVMVRSIDDMRGVVEHAVEAMAQGQRLPFVLQDRASSAVIGSSSYLNPDPANLHVEIGATWIAGAYEGKAANPEAKRLMLGHAFESWGCRRVEFKTDSLNARSRAALLKLGAKEEGTLRNHMRTPSGRMRHSVYYSVTDEEWPAVKAGLEARLAGLAA
jgi:RimJ/RimL family protein N-acetyltransferase